MNGNRKECFHLDLFRKSCKRRGNPQQLSSGVRDELVVVFSSSVLFVSLESRNERRRCCADEDKGHEAYGGIRPSSEAPPRL